MSDDHDEDEIVERSPDGRYVRFRQSLGVGAFKSVFKAYDEEEGIEVAWCQVSLDRADAQVVAQIYKEVEILKSLQHKNILTFFTYFKLTEVNSRASPNSLVFITEIMTSGTLKQYIAKAKRVKRKVVKKWCRQILDGLAYLHSNHIIHRDLKCDNIFINGNNSEIKIGDLGLSTLMREGPAQSVLGTPEFMAPELYDELYDEKVDIYAFGMSVLEMVTSEYPYSECSNAAQIYRKVTMKSKPAALEKIQDEETRKFIDLCLLHDHKERPSAAALLEHEWLRLPFGGLSSDDDKPVVLVGSGDTPAPHPATAPSSDAQVALAIQTPVAPAAPVVLTAPAILEHAPSDASLGQVGVAATVSDSALDGAPNGTLPHSAAYLHQPGSAMLQMSSTPPRTSNSAEKGEDSYDIDLTCSILIDGEHRSVTFQMDLNTDTAEAIAAEMIEELHLSSTDGTREDIINQINAFLSGDRVSDDVVGIAVGVPLAITQPDSEASLLQSMPPPPPRPVGRPRGLPVGGQLTIPPAEHLAVDPDGMRPPEYVPGNVHISGAVSDSRLDHGTGEAMTVSLAKVSSAPADSPPHDISSLGSSFSSQNNPDPKPNVFGQSQHAQVMQGKAGQQMQYQRPAARMPPAGSAVQGYPGRPHVAHQQPFQRVPPQQPRYFACGAGSSDDGSYDDPEDQDLMRTIAAQQKKEMDELISRHTQQNKRMKEMIKKRRNNEQREMLHQYNQPTPQQPQQYQALPQQTQQYAPPPPTADQYHPPQPREQQYHQPPPQEPRYHAPSNEPQFHPPPQHETQFHPPPQHEPQFHPPLQHEPQFHQPPQHETQFHPPPQHEPQFHPPLQHETQFHPPLQHEPQFHPPLQHEPQFHPPPQHETQFHPPPQHEPQFHPPLQHEPQFHQPPQHETQFHPPSQHETQFQKHEPQFHPPLLHEPQFQQHEPQFHPPLQHEPQFQQHEPQPQFHPPPQHETQFHPPPQQYQQQPPQHSQQPYQQPQMPPQQMQYVQQQMPMQAVQPAIMHQGSAQGMVQGSANWPSDVQQQQHAPSQAYGQQQQQIMQQQSQGQLQQKYVQKQPRQQQHSQPPPPHHHQHPPPHQHQPPQAQQQPQHPQAQQQQQAQAQLPMQYAPASQAPMAAPQFGQQPSAQGIVSQMAPAMAHWQPEAGVSPSAAPSSAPMWQPDAQPPAPASAATIQPHGLAPLPPGIPQHEQIVSQLQLQVQEKQLQVQEKRQQFEESRQQQELLQQQLQQQQMQMAQPSAQQHMPMQQQQLLPQHHPQVQQLQMSQLTGAGPTAASNRSSIPEGELSPNSATQQHQISPACSTSLAPAAYGVVGSAAPADYTCSNGCVSTGGNMMAGAAPTAQHTAAPPPVLQQQGAGAPPSQGGAQEGVAQHGAAQHGVAQHVAPPQGAPMQHGAPQQQATAPMHQQPAQPQQQTPPQQQAPPLQQQPPAQKPVGQQRKQAAQNVPQGQQLQQMAPRPVPPQQQPPGQPPLSPQHAPPQQQAWPAQQPRSTQQPPSSANAGIAPIRSVPPAPAPATAAPGAGGAPRAVTPRSTGEEAKLAAASKAKLMDQFSSNLKTAKSVLNASTDSLGSITSISSASGRTSPNGTVRGAPPRTEPLASGGAGAGRGRIMTEVEARTIEKDLGLGLSSGVTR